MTGMLSLTPDDKTKLQEVVDAGVAMLRDFDVQKEGLKATVTDLAEQLDIKPKLINDAIRAIYKGNIEDLEDNLGLVKSIMVAAGHAVE